MIIKGDAHHIPLADKSINCIITSTPYWSLRKYDIPDLIWDESEIPWEKDCKHEWGTSQTEHDNLRFRGENSSVGNEKKIEIHEGKKDSGGQFCLLCSAWRGQLGLEPTIDLYLKHLLQIMDECKRVLRDDGVMFINLGDSYGGSGGAHKPHHANPGISKSSERDGVPNVPSYGKNHKVPQDCPLNDSIWNRPCDGCEVVSVLRNFDKGHLKVGKLIDDSHDPSREHKEFENDHLPTSDSLNQKRIPQSSFATQDLNYSANHVDGQPPSSLESKTALSSPLPQAMNLQLGKGASSPSIQDSFSLDVSEIVDMRVSPCDSQINDGGLQGQTSHISCSEEIDGASVSHKKGRAYVTCPYQHYSITLHQNQVPVKSLSLIPYRFAIAMIEKGWICRNTIIWKKPNCIPSSAKDRFSVDFEYVFFFVKNRRYYFEQQYDGYAESTLLDKRDPLDAPRKERGYPGQPQHGGHLLCDSKKGPGRNRRCVWTIPTQPYPESHFATFPEALVEPMITAGCPIGGIVLDPFCGSGTVIKVAEKLQRQGIGIDLGYQELSEKRIKWNQVEIFE